MAIFKTRELAEKLGVTPQTLNKQASRNKLVIVNGEIDDQHPVNKLYIEKKIGSVPLIIKPVEELKLDKTEAQDKKGRLIDEKTGQVLVDFDAVKKDQLQNEKLVEEIAIKKLQKQKLLGEVIPVEIVKRIFGLHFKNISVEFYNAVDNYTTIINQKVGGTREDLAEIRVTLKEVVNKFINEAKVQSKDDLQAIVNEYISKKGRGEAD